ncbi:hypothetical protein MERGE_001746 [Pneumocystis wakefieldiae]|uniref:Homologous-pairing protein 2 homolog n=1 Tax=Pneumocystis wakefieldiae TaxID=38082 RepID=A0A899FVW6_9ASCO|nr:hypothetical protein MERGE_001746 [Pneumocystis wakefieldiae]
MTKSKAQSNKKDEESLVLDYLRKTNRPYSATDICLNLHNAVTKTALAKILTSLTERGEIRCKTYGKQSIYVIDQEQFENPSSEELATMDARIEELWQQINDAQEKNKQMKQEEKEMIQKNYQEMRKMWKERKALFRNLWDAISEGESSPTELKERLGIEEDVIDFNIDPLSGIQY